MNAQCAECSKRYQYTTKPYLRAQKNTTLHRTVRKIRRENERCDELARAFAAGPDLPEDTGFTAAQA